MLIKSKELIGPMISKLEDLLVAEGLSTQRREWIEEEIQSMRAGNRGERDAAYYIDFELGRSDNYAVLHDLRIEHEGRVAQVDHLIIGRMLDVILIESKNFSTAVRVNAHGEFEVKTRYGWKGMQSPVEQNRRHALVLADFLKTSGLLPKRLGVQIAPEFHQWVLVSPQCMFSRSSNNAAHEAQIVKMDMFGARLKQWQEKSGDLWKIMKAISSESLRDLGLALAAQHRPVSFDYAAKFGIFPELARSCVDARFAPPQPHVAICVAKTGQPAKTPAKCCEECNAPLEEKVITFCRLNSSRFHRKLLCRACQPKAAVEPAVNCESCRASVNEKVVEFCQANSARFEKKILCRKCQRTAAMAA
jgi:hypothetical protein